MSSWFRALAIDYDNTLTTTPRPADDVLAAVREVRDAGWRVVLVTGRILAELRADFPDVDRHFDAIVAENGAVLSRAGVALALAAPIDMSLEEALVRRGVPLRRGQVILATAAAHDIAVIEEVARLGLEAQLIFNRSALMVVPHDTSKGSGTIHGLAALGISPHSAVAIGDAENDHSLLDVCEVGVAVGNAVEALKTHADVVLDASAGEAVAAFLRGPLRGGLPDVESRRWRVRLGADAAGAPVTIPASRVNVGLFGGSGQGKSYLAGLFAERLVALGYTVCVLDLEGDHVGLSTLHGVIAFGGHDPLPPAEQLGTLFAEGMGSAVIDLSMHSLPDKRGYALAALDACSRSRAHLGTPQWIIVEEGQVPLAAHAGTCTHPAPWTTGLCIVSYRPEAVCRAATAMIDIELRCAEDGSAVVRIPGERPRRFIPDRRATPHDRHWHKYISGGLPAYRHFHFRTVHGPTGESAGNIDDFRAEVGRAGRGVLRHHAAHGDFSRWLGDLSHDARFVERIRVIEAGLREAASEDDVETHRGALLTALESCYARSAVVAT